MTKKTNLERIKESLHIGRELIIRNEDTQMWDKGWIDSIEPEKDENSIVKGVIGNYKFEISIDEAEKLATNKKLQFITSRKKTPSSVVANKTSSPGFSNNSTKSGSSSSETNRRSPGFSNNSTNSGSSSVETNRCSPGFSSNSTSDESDDGIGVPKNTTVVNYIDNLLENHPQFNSSKKPDALPINSFGQTQQNYWYEKRKTFIDRLRAQKARQMQKASKKSNANQRKIRVLKSFLECHMSKEGIPKDVRAESHDEGLGKVDMTDSSEKAPSGIKPNQIIISDKKRFGKFK